MKIEVKICGLRDEAALKAVIEGGVAFAGFVFYARSKNVVAPMAARKLATLIPSCMKKTGLFVDATDEELLAVTKYVPLDLLQLHGDESPERVIHIRTLTGLPVMKALRMTKVQHLEAIPAYEAVADRLLFDSRIGDEPSGGPIDWKLLKGRAFAKPWMLAGGLNTKNLAAAVLASGATAVDVSSGVEDTPGHKSPDKIRAFLAVAAQL